MDVLQTGAHATGDYRSIASKLLTGRSARTRPPRDRAVLLDAFGTLVEMEPPAPLLRAALAAEGHAHQPDACERAIGAEIAFYRRHHLRGVDEGSLAELRGECAAVLASELGADTPPPGRMTELLLDSLRFRALPDAEACLHALSEAGFRVAVVSNWDVSLTRTLRSLGLEERLDAVVASASVGYAKPHPAPFAAALAAVRVSPERAIHCGDSPREDGHGARVAGLASVQLDRGGVADLPGPVIRGLAELPGVAERLLGPPPPSAPPENA